MHNDYHPVSNYNDNMAEAYANGIAVVVNDLIAMSDDWHGWTRDDPSDELQELDSIILNHLGDRALSVLGATRLDRMRAQENIQQAELDYDDDVPFTSDRTSSYGIGMGG